MFLLWHCGFGGGIGVLAAIYITAISEVGRDVHVSIIEYCMCAFGICTCLQH